MPTVICSRSKIVLPSSSMRESMTGADHRPQPRFWAGYSFARSRPI